MNYRIRRVEIDNVAGCEYAAFDVPESMNVIEIAGRNGAGKSSVIEALRLALDGSDVRRVPQPVNVSAERAEVRVTLDRGDETLVVRRWWTDPEHTYSEVRDGDGNVVKINVKKLLPSLFADARRFLTGGPKEQRDQLLRACGAKADDLAAIDGKKEAALRKRRAADEQLSYLRVQREKMPRPEGAVPADEEALEPYREALEKAVAADTELNDLRSRLETSELNLKNLGAIRANEKRDEDERRQNVVAEIKRIEASLQDARDRLGLIDERLAAWDEVTAQRRTEIEAEIDRIDKKISKREPSAAVKAAREAMAEREARNERVRQRKALHEKDDEIAAKEKEVAAATAAARDADKEKVAFLSQLELPADGLTVDDEGIWLRGIRFKQVNYAERVFVALVVAMAEDPALPVLLLEEASTLDDATRDRMRGWAHRHGWQIFIESIYTRDPGHAIVMRDGKMVTL